MIDWTALVAEIVPNLPNDEAKTPCSDPTCRNKPVFSEIVGTAETRVNSGFEVFCSDVPTVPTAFECSRVDEHEKCNPSSFIEPAGGVPEGQSAPHKKAGVSSCWTCAHLRRPGLSDGLCSGRDDLPPAYTLGHPLRQLPADGGVSCPIWRVHPMMGGADLAFAPRVNPAVSASSPIFTAPSWRRRW